MGDTPERELTVSQEAAVLNDVSHEIGANEQEKGFREDWELAAWLSTWIDEPDVDITQEEHDKLNLIVEALRTNYIGTKLALICSEVVGEALETLRDNGASGVLEGKGNFGEETADAHIRLFALEQLLRIPAGDEILKKMSVNAERPHKHGRKV